MPVRAVAPFSGALRRPRREAAVNHAVDLYRRQHLSFGAAAEAAGMSKAAFQALLMRRKVWLHYDEADLQSDLATLRGLVPR